MSWICDYCSTTNEDHNTECFVCGKSRSKESIREAKRIAREERSRTVNAEIYQKTTRAGKIVCFSSIALFCAITLILITLKMRNDFVGDLIYSGIAVIENFGQNFAFLFGVNFVSIFKHIFHFSLNNLFTNCGVICLYVAGNIQGTFGTVITELFVNKSIKYEILFQKIIIIMDSISNMFQQWFSIISTLVSDLIGVIAAGAHNLGAIFEKVKEPFLNFKK